jgi:hypothetical protein
MKIYALLETILKSEPNYVTDEGDLKKWVVIGYSAAKVATIPLQSTPPIPLQRSPRFRCKVRHLFRSKVHHFTPDLILVKD